MTHIVKHVSRYRRRLFKRRLLLVTCFLVCAAVVWGCIAFFSGSPQPAGSIPDETELTNAQITDAEQVFTKKSLLSYQPGSGTAGAERYSVEDGIISVPVLSQSQGYPTGCESVSAVTALRYLGVDISVDTFIDDCLDIGAPPHYEDGIRYGCDPYEAFPGDPRSSKGYGCFSPVIERACIRAVGTQPYTVERLSGLTLDDLCIRYIKNGIPVIVWATIDMTAPSPGSTWIVRETGRTIQWMTPMHCLLLVGYIAES